MRRIRRTLWLTLLLAAAYAQQTVTSSTGSDPGVCSTALPDTDADMVAMDGNDTANFESFERWKHMQAEKIRLAGTKAEKDAQCLPVTDSVVSDHTSYEGIPLSAANSEGTVKSEPPSSSLDSATIATDTDSIPSTSQSLEAPDPVLADRDRFNYASLDCAATILKHNLEAKGSGNILSEDRDRYMLNPCAASSQFFIVELCADILVDTIYMGNYEFFSSVFKEFRLSVSDRYPVKPQSWKILGTFQALNTRKLQRFHVETPLIWAKYLRIEILGHYGNEYYCPISVLRVLGTSMIEDIRDNEIDGRTNEHSQDEFIEPLDAASSANIHNLASAEQQTTIMNNSSQKTDTLGSTCTSRAEDLNVTLNACLESDATGSGADAASPRLSNFTEACANVSISPQNAANVTAATSCKAPIQHSKTVDEKSQTKLGGASTDTPQSSATSPPIIPATQESIYKSIIKRLNTLEANTSYASEFLERQRDGVLALLSTFESDSGKKINSTIQSWEQSIADLVRLILINFNTVQKQIYERDLKQAVIEMRQMVDMSRNKLGEMAPELSSQATEIKYLYRFVITELLAIIALGTYVFYGQMFSATASYTRADAPAQALDFPAPPEKSEMPSEDVALGLRKREIRNSVSSCRDDILQNANQHMATGSDVSIRS